MYMSLYTVIQFVMQYEKNNTRPLNKYLAMKKRKIKFIVHISLHRTNINIQRGWPVLNCRLVNCKLFTANHTYRLHFDSVSINVQYDDITLSAHS